MKKPKAAKKAAQADATFLRPLPTSPPPAGKVKTK
jgi:hypothetical protein